MIFLVLVFFGFSSYLKIVNQSFFTTEEQLIDLFGKVGDVQGIINHHWVVLVKKNTLRILLCRILLTRRCWKHSTMHQWAPRSMRTPIKKKEKTRHFHVRTIGFIISQINIISRERGNRISRKTLKNDSFTLWISFRKMRFTV